MTSLPNEQEEREHGIHWRAVPSLREIWAEERQRMKVLLSVNDNFLTGGAGEPDERTRKSENSKGAASQFPPPFTLSVKKGATVPGSRLASRGIKKLYQSSPEVEIDFRRAMNDIVCRHKCLIERTDAKLSEKYINKSLTNKQFKLKPRHFSPKSALKLQTSSPKVAEDEALLALQGLARQFASDLTPDKHMRTPEPSQHMFEENERISQAINAKFGIEYSTPPVMLRTCSQMSCLPPMTQEVLEEVEDALDFCRGVDNGDVTSLLEDFKVEGSYQSNECINPLTLTPYENPSKDEGFLDEEDNMGEDAIERSLSILATQSTIRSHGYVNDSEERLISGIPACRFDDINEFSTPHSQANVCKDSPVSIRHNSLGIYNRHEGHTLNEEWSNNVEKVPLESISEVHVQSQNSPSSSCNSMNDLPGKSPKPQSRSLFSIDPGPISPCDRMNCIFELKECLPLRNAFENGRMKVVS